MRYISTFSDIEAASVAWAPTRGEPIAFRESDAFRPVQGHITLTVSWADWRFLRELCGMRRVWELRGDERKRRLRRI